MNILRVLYRLLLLSLFLIFCLYWLSVCFFMVQGIVTGGVPGAAHWLIHIDRGHSDPSHYIPHWGSILARMVAIAAITFFLWLANRRVLKELVDGMKGIWTSER